MPKINNDTFYLNALKKHGHTPKGLNWKDKRSQNIKFEIILEFLNDRLSSESNRSKCANSLIFLLNIE